MKSGSEVREEFRRKGQTIAGWAKKNGFRPQTVRRVIDEESRCYYGKAHQIAVLLGMKDGEILSD
jgi:gp16 family phage-associated protein